MATVPVGSPRPAHSAPGIPGEGPEPNGRRAAPPPRRAGFSQAVVSSRNWAFVVALVVAVWAWASLGEDALLVLPVSLEALIAALIFVAIFFVAWLIGGLGAFAGWLFGRRYGRPREGASGGALGCWLFLALAGALGSAAGAFAPVAYLAVLLSPWIGARWLGPLTGRFHRGLARLPTQFNGWAVRRLISRRHRIDLRGPFLGAAAGLLIGLASLLPPLQYPEALLLASRISLRNQPVNTAAGTIEWQQVLRRAPARRRPPSMAIVEMDSAVVGRALSRSSEAALNVEALERLRGWGVQRIVVPVVATMPRDVRTPRRGEPQSGWVFRDFKDAFYWRRPPLPDAALARLQADTPRLAAALRATPQAIVCRVPAPASFTWYYQAHRAEELVDRLLRSGVEAGSAEFGVYHVEQLPTLRAQDGEGRAAVPLLLLRPPAATSRTQSRPATRRSWPADVPAVRSEELLLNVGASGAEALVPHVSYSALLSGHRIYNPQTGRSLPPERFFRNRIVFLDTVYQPQFPTPVGRLTAMELLATAVDNLTESRPLAPWAPGLLLLATVLCGALVGRLSLGRSPLHGFAHLTAVLFVLFVLGFALFVFPGIWLPLFPMTAAGLLAFLLVNQFVFAVDDEELQRQRAEQMQHDRELALSREIQTSLLPEGVTRLEEFILVSRSEPAREVGGDFCSIFPLVGEEGVLGVTVGDVAGKGIRGAMYMTVATTLLEARAAPWATPQRVLADVNRRLYPRIRGLRMFVTAIYGTLDAATGEFVYASAGQVPPLHLTAEGQVTYLPAAGAPLGCLPEPRYRDERITLRPGECLLLASDGFVEARGAKGQPLGYDGFLELVRRQLPQPPEALLDALFAEIRAYLSEGDHDDLTLLLIHRQAGP